jgi:hypothetical protein
MDSKTKVRLAFAAAIVLACWSAWLWQPERQVRLHHGNFLKAVERRSWSRMRNFLADNYSDRWGHDKEIVMQGVSSVFRQFIFVTVEHAERSIELGAGDATVRSMVKISGNGGALAQFAMTKVNKLSEPFEFEWRKQSWKPWDWQLVRVDHPSMEVERGLSF